MNNITTIPLGMVNVYLIQGHEADKLCYALVDTGNKSDALKILRVLDTMGIDPKQIKLIVLTHGHTDHFNGLKALKKLTGAKVIASKVDYDIMTQGLDDGIKGVVWWAKVMFAIIGLLPKKQNKAPEYEADEFIEETYALSPWGIDGSLVMTPGHTKGSLSVYLDNGEAIIGDSLMDFSKRGKPTKPFIAYDLKVIYDSIQHLIEMGAKHFYLSHGTDYSLETIQAALKTLI